MANQGGIRIVSTPPIGVKQAKKINFLIDDFTTYLAKSNEIRRKGSMVELELGNRNGYPLIWDFYTQLNDANDAMTVVLKLRDMPCSVLKEPLDMKAKISFKVGPTAETTPIDMAVVGRTSCQIDLVLDQIRSILQMTGSNSVFLTVTAYVYGTDQKELGFGQKILDDLGKILETGANSDVKIYVEKDERAEEFYTRKAHQSILCARSSKFAQLLGPESKARKDGRLYLKDLYAESLDALLTFIYTGKMADSWIKMNVIKELLEASQKFNLPDLASFYDRYLICIRTKENVGDLFLLASKYKLSTAREKLDDYLQANPNLSRLKKIK